MLALSTSIMDEIAKDKEVEEQIRTGLIAKIESCFDTTLICYLFNGNNDSNNMTVISFVYSYETGWLYLFGAKSTTVIYRRAVIIITFFPGLSKDIMTIANIGMFLSSWLTNYRVLKEMLSYKALLVEKVFWKKTVKKTSNQLLANKYIKRQKD
ncbi:Glutamyl-tRNA(Gln) amidotransferase subunit [Dirofilaria immitis]